MRCSVKPAARRLYRVGRGAVSCWNAVTLATRSFRMELTVLQREGRWGAE